MIDDIISNVMSSLVPAAALVWAHSEMRKSYEEAAAGPSVSIRGTVAEGFTVIHRTGGKLHDHPDGPAFAQYGPAGEPLLIIRCKDPGKVNTIECLPA